MLNNDCNLKCPYCFAEECRDTLAKQQSENISISNFLRAVNFVTKTDRHIGLIGGEPTIHPEFSEILEIACSHEKINSITLFTNGINLEPFMEQLLHPKVGILINLNSPTIVGQKNYDRIIKNIETLMEKYGDNPRITIGYNIYEEEPDFDYIIQALRKFKFTKLRISTVVPNSIDKRNVKPLDYFHKMKNGLFELLVALKYYGVVPMSDCNFIPLCVYTENELKWLEQSFAPLADQYKMKCNLLEDRVCHMGPIDIFPNLQISRCFGMSENLRLDMKDFKDLSEVRNYFLFAIENPSFNIVTDDDCLDCKKRKTLQCSGGCLAFKTEELEKWQNKKGNI